jgi:malonyl-CoA decarboxylase
VKFLVDLRADLLVVRDRDPALQRLEADLREILGSWFDVGFLELKRITWDAPASLLEKLAAYEAVHEVRTWIDLKNRLDVDRRCFAFFHPVMPTEPLIFVEVALVEELSASVAELLDHAAPVGDPRGASVAIFYSISNCQRGLAGISFGNALIKRVVGELQSEFRGLRTFATLSPIPGFRAWLDTRLAQSDSKTLVKTVEREALQTIAEGAGDGERRNAPLQTILSRRSWYRKAQIANALRDPLMRLCAHYLLEEKRSGMRALDPVAHFHLSNGARMERLNWLADVSPRGLRESAGMMVNYVYRTDQIDENSEAYLSEAKIATSTSMRSLLR